MPGQMFQLYMNGSQMSQLPKDDSDSDSDLECWEPEKVAPAASRSLLDSTDTGSETMDPAEDSQAPVKRSELQKRKRLVRKRDESDDESDDESTVTDSNKLSGSPLPPTKRRKRRAPLVDSDCESDHDESSTESEDMSCESDTINPSAPLTSEQRCKLVTEWSQVMAGLAELEKLQTKVDNALTKVSNFTPANVAKLETFANTMKRILQLMDLRRVEMDELDAMYETLNLDE